MTFENYVVSNPGSFPAISNLQICYSSFWLTVFFYGLKVGIVPTAEESHLPWFVKHKVSLGFSLHKAFTNKN